VVGEVVDVDEEHSRTRQSGGTVPGGHSHVSNASFVV